MSSTKNLVGTDFLDDAVGEAEAEEAVAGVATDFFWIIGLSVGFPGAGAAGMESRALVTLSYCDMPEMDSDATWNDAYRPSCVAFTPDSVCWTSSS